MRRITLILLALAIASIAAMAQKLTVDVTNGRADEVFADVMHRAGYNYSYDSSLLKGMTVSVHETDASLPTILDRMFAGTDVKWKILGRSVVLTQNNNNAPKVRRVIVSGYVVEQGSAEPLIGAIVRSGRETAATNTAGHYTLHLMPGAREITVTFPGFIPASKTLDVDGNRHLNFSLAEPDRDSRLLPEVVVEADRNSHIAINSTDIGRVNLTRADIEAAPALFGEADVIKTLQMQPGVTAGVEGLASMYVHGGESDENLYMLDNVPLYQVNHFGGLFSAFNTEAIKNVDFYKSSFPARYNGRLSSIMAVNTRDGSNDGHHGQLRLGLTSGAFSLEGPLPGGKTTYSVAVRRSWFDAVTVPALAIYNSKRKDGATTVTRYSFLDVNAKVTHNLSERSRIHLMFYYGDDNLKGGSKHHYQSVNGIPKERSESNISRLKWGNTVGSAGWRMQWTDRLWSELTGYISHYRSRLNNRTDEHVLYDEGFEDDFLRDYDFRNRITDLAARADFGLSLGSGRQLAFGGSYTRHRFSPGVEHTRLFRADTLVSDIVVSRPVNAGEWSGYAGCTMEITDRLLTDAGINVGLFQIDGHTHNHLDPRASMRLYVKDESSIKISYARTSQYVHQLTQSAIDLPTDQWVPITGNLKPQRADKVSAGYYHRFNKGLTLSAEVYYKWMHNLIDYRDDYYIKPASAPWEELLCTGSGRAKGLDIMVTRSFGKFTGHAGYTLMWTDRLFANKNGGRRFPSRNDNRHKINLLLTWKINQRWDVSAAWQGMSGNMVTLSTQDYKLMDVPGMPILGDPSFTGNLDFISGTNNIRLPFYHRLDLSANRYTNRGKWTFSLYNAYCNMNVIALRKNMWRPEYAFYPAAAWPAPYEKLRLIPIIPSVSYTWIF